METNRLPVMCKAGVHLTRLWISWMCKAGLSCCNNGFKHTIWWPARKDVSSLLLLGVHPVASLTSVSGFALLWQITPQCLLLRESHCRTQRRFCWWSIWWLYNSSVSVILFISFKTQINHAHLISYFYQRNSWIFSLLHPTTFWDFSLLLANFLPSFYNIWV